MASLNKLAIRGIRSFDDKQIAVIEFFSPVTVIVGHNGSGKTTIIECLKYATTGDQPPGTRGGAFVHDPKMANEKEVKAQVKLRFFAANGTRMLAVRNLSVTMKKTAGMTMKTLEGILAVDDGKSDKGGKRSVISTKCAEMDDEIPNLLGVSKAVLENVIFCHQEDSYWPLAEPAALKKKFDDIFEATRYTKALDSIKTLRKERVAGLKTEKERLEGLAREKAHADKLKARMTDLSSTIATKEIKQEELAAELEEAITSNHRLNELASKFREVFLKVDNLEKEKQRYEAEFIEAKTNAQIVEGTEEELRARLENFDSHMAAQKNEKRKQDNVLDETEEELRQTRRAHVQLNNEHGALKSDAKAQERRLEEREALVRKISAKHNIRGFDHSPLERDKILEFKSRLDSLQTKQTDLLDSYKEENRSKNEAYNRELSKLRGETQRLQMEQTNIREQMNERQRSIAQAEEQIDASQKLEGELHMLRENMEDREVRLKKIVDEIQAAKHDEKLAERTARGRELEDKKDALNKELKTLSLQADSRAKLDLKKQDVRSKQAEVKSMLQDASTKMRKLLGVDVDVQNMEFEVARALREKEHELSEVEKEAGTANKDLQQAETAISSLQEQLKKKKKELKDSEKKIKEAIEDIDFGKNDERTIKSAINIAAEELRQLREDTSHREGAIKVFEKLLASGKSKKKCTVCDRHMSGDELAVFERYLKDQIKRNFFQEDGENAQQIKDWEDAQEELQKVAPLEATANRMKLEEIPSLQAQLNEKENEVPNLSTIAEKAQEKVDACKQELRELGLLRSLASDIVRIQRDVDRLTKEIGDLERDLAVTGSTRTPDDLEMELDAISDDIRANERDKQSLMREKERLAIALRSLEKDIQDQRLQEFRLESDIKEKKSLEQRKELMRAQNKTDAARLKDLDASIQSTQAPIERLQVDFAEKQRGLDVKIEEAQVTLQELNRSVDNFEDSSKAIERYVREKGAKKLRDCEEHLAQYEEQVKKLGEDAEKARERQTLLAKEISDSNSTIASLRENVRIRKLERDIRETQVAIESHDVEEAARSRRIYEERYVAEKKRETDIQSALSRVGGELSSHKDQLKESERDMREFKNINKMYTEQLLKVKMSEMANSDLEKYAKALDSAIMKYHSLKMAEVNDTMRHLWNKTYQGTDIDGIKIVSDVEGGASKRSYNYRVVMTKDQVEMDMRGRCSAGQKMLASIIIRLALSDSFGQNCGILALDEPTNALDTENIDALANSLIDIINERKNHSNFQLIIITHDENFLQKLGQNDVMEYYWRVSRDARQKSVIERQRVR